MLRLLGLSRTPCGVRAAALARCASTYLRPHVAVYLILGEAGTSAPPRTSIPPKILMSLRQNTGFMDGHYSLCAGHVDEGETVFDAMIREAKEEIGISLSREHLSIRHCMQRQSDRMYFDFYLLALQWEGQVLNMEPKKCGGLAFFPLSALPENTVPSVRAALEFCKAEVPFSVHGFGKQ